MQYNAMQLGIFYSNQLGGIKQCSTEDAGIFLTHLIYAGWTKGLKTSMVAFVMDNEQNSYFWKGLPLCVCKAIRFFFFFFLKNSTIYILVREGRLVSI
jgi:hypothetical protein